ncbi:MAG: XrtA-associated tyrosine autokinase, partial [Candidatus Accumulibacter phosphatis]|nr:XrtA-associated tyrosine autokinase [Candidatus Accumulibacter phosphatis]
MMSLIEQAAKRLEQLRKAGVEIPGSIAEHERLPADLRAVAPAQPETAQVQSLEVLPATTESASANTPQSRRIELDLNTLAATGLISPDAPRSQLADQYRVIKRPLIANAMGKSATPIKRGNLIMVTSAISGEGKTFTAINLAMSIAMELDNTVMLVDADVPKPSVLKMLGLPPAPGLLDVLTDESVALSHVLMRTNVDKLSLLPSGTQHQRATELLASEAMIKLLDEMANRYPDRIIIFDSPPLLMTTESRVLASHMGQVIVVVRAERTARSDVKHALA